MNKYIDSFISLFYPKVCFNCDKPLVNQEEILCLHCYLQLPHTQYHKEKNNPLLLKLNGSTELTEAYAMLKYEKKNMAQKIIHALKYKDQKKIGMVAGKWIGHLINKSTTIEYDFLLPVPLHPKKLRIRGYNQAELLANGMADVMGTAVNKNTIRRTRFSSTQTKKGRLKRWADTEALYEVINKESIDGKKILIVDDVITTGATIIQIANLLKEKGASIVSVACVATGK